MPTEPHQFLVAQWRDILAAAQRYVADLPALMTFILSVGQALEDVTASKAQQINLETRRLQATQDYHDYVAAGREEVARLRSYVKSAFGTRDERLAEFGIKPARPRRRRLPRAGGQDGSPGYH